MESGNLLIHVITTVSLLLPLASTAIPTTTLQSATEILSSSGHLSMSLTLELISNTLLPHSPSLTIFSPNDAAFALYGQPSLSLLQYHFSPLSFTPHSLSLLSPLSPIPTLLPNYSLTVSPQNEALYINGIKLSPTPLFDDGNLVIYSIDRFLDPDYISTVKSIGNCNSSGVSETSLFEGAIKALRDARYKEMTSFLESQMLGYVNNWGEEMTIFSPTDDEEEEWGRSRMMKYVVGCRMTWQELESVEEGVEMKSYEKGYGIKIGRSGDIVLVNDVPVAYPDLYVSDSIVVHGLRGAFEDVVEAKNSHENGFDDEF